MVLGILGCIAGFRSIHTVRFVNKQGMPILAVIAQHRSKRQAQEAFVAAIQKQLAMHGTGADDELVAPAKTNSPAVKSAPA